jgi:hypothetical protein
MSDVSDSLVYQLADYHFERLSARLRRKLKSMPPSGNSRGVKTLYQELRQDYTLEASDLCREAWLDTLHHIVEPMVTELPVTLRRVLYVATDNGGQECVLLTDGRKVECSGPWIEQAIIGRLGLP